MRRLSEVSIRVGSLAMCVWLGAAAPARADAVTTWNDIAMRAIGAGRPGTVGVFDAALVQAAVHDAVQAYEGRFEPYRVRIDEAEGRPEAAVVAAAHGVLVTLYPAQQASLDADLDAYLQAHGLVGDPGLAVGQEAAAAMVALHRPAMAMPAYYGSNGIGEWRPTPSYLGNPPLPPPYSPMAVLYVAYTTPFTLNRTSQFRPEPPPPIRSGQYLRDYDEVKAYGARNSSVRTPAQTDMAYFWTDEYIAQWNRALRGVAEARLTSLGDSARLFALANLAMADALITCWDSKYHYSFWRPVTAIQEGDADGNDRTEGDPAWEPLANTPNYAEYPSGANNVTGAVTTVLQRYFGTDALPLVVTSNAPLAVQKTRTYARISDAAAEVVDARMLLGFHFRFADDAARRQGSRVADWVYRKTLRPVRGRRR